MLAKRGLVFTFILPGGGATRTPSHVSYAIGYTTTCTVLFIGVTDGCRNFDADPMSCFGKATLYARFL